MAGGGDFEGLEGGIGKDEGRVGVLRTQVEDMADFVARFLEFARSQKKERKFCVGIEVGWVELD